MALTNPAGDSLDVLIKSVDLVLEVLVVLLDLLYLLVVLSVHTALHQVVLGLPALQLLVVLPDDLQVDVGLQVDLPLELRDAEGDVEVVVVEGLEGHVEGLYFELAVRNGGVP